MKTAAAYDYIIVGAGSAGCVLANRLSENPLHSVLLIETGPPDSSAFIHMPRGFGKTLKDPRLTWYFVTEPEPGNAHRPYVWVRGKTLGGSSAVNGMIYVRGHPQDYDRWAELGNAGWSWRDMLPCFRQIEDHELGANEYRGAGGPLQISIQRSASALTEALFAAAEALGVAYKEDLNEPDHEGIGYTPRTIWNGRRVSAASAFLRPIRRRSNLTILTGTQVEKVLFDGRRAVGVFCTRKGRSAQYRCGGEIILSAGAIQSPKILQVSGVGPADLLQSVGVRVICDSPGVGANLREHKLVMMQHRLRRPLSINRELAGWRLRKNALRYFLFRTGVLASTYDVNAFVRTRPELERPDAQLTFSAFSLDYRRNGQIAFESQPGMQVFGYPLHTESQGSIRIRSPDPSVPAVIRSNHLAAEHDRRATVDVFRYLRRLFQQAPLRGLVSEETRPGPAVQTASDILDACSRDDSCAHAIGSCRMGQDSMAVVDERLRVRGVEGLRVMDCSVMPTQVSGNTNGPVMAMAWRASQLILKK